MLEYIKQQLAAQQPVTFEDPTPSDDDMDSLVTEYATSIFQELDDLSIEGADAHRERPIELDIPIEEDVELDTVELNLMDNRLVDVPMDVTTNMESFVEQMKTFEDFYQEACEVVKPFMRSDDEETLELRRINHARKAYNEYRDQMIQEGLFGFEKISLTDPSVPTSIMESFGVLDETNPDQKYIVRLPVMFELSYDNKILRSQLDTLQVAERNMIYEQFTDVLKNKLNVQNPWDNVIPKKIIVPQTRDDYELIVEFECDSDTDPIYEGWAYRRKPSERDVEIHSYPHESIKDIVENITMMNKKDYVHQESYIENITPDRWNIDPMFQESVGKDIRKSNKEIIKSLKSCGRELAKIAKRWNKSGGYNEKSAKMVDPQTMKLFVDQFGELANSSLPDNKYKAEFKYRNENFKAEIEGVDRSKIIMSNPGTRDLGEGLYETHIKQYIGQASDLYKLGVKYMKSISKDVDLSDAKFMEAYELDLDVYQEAIDFGYPDETTEAAKQNQPAPGGDATNNDPSAPTVSTDANTETPPPAEDAPIDANADNMEQPPATDTPPVEGEEPKTPLDPNDVSDQIANNVMDDIDNQEQQNQDTGVDPNGDISIDDNTTPPDDSTPDNNDMSDSVNFDNIDTSLDNLDTNATDTSTDDTTMGDPANMDINTMSIDDIMAQAAEKLKSMPIEQVKQFLSDGAVGMESYQEPVRQVSERSRLNDELKNLLGILNSGKKLPELVDSFKKYGKLMNVDITKVTKDSKEFTQSEIQLLNTLTARTNNLMIAIKPTSDKTQTDHIKACIKDFLAIADKARKILDK